MKKITAILFALCLIVPVLFAEGISKKDIIGKENRFQINGEVYFVEFIDENYYTFCSPYGGYLWKNYPYSLNGNTLILENNGEKVFNPDWMQDIVFPEGKAAVLTWDEDYNDFVCKGVFKNETVILRNFKNKTPAGTECILQGLKVIKYDTAKSHLVATDNLKIRKSPSLKAETGTFNYTNYICSGSPVRHPLGEEFAQYSEYTVKDDQYFPLLLAGLVVGFDAVTVEKETIDGITAPWYRIVMYDKSDEGCNQYFWVFGGYIKEVTDINNPDYIKTFMNSAMNKGILQK